MSCMIETKHTNVRYRDIFKNISPRLVHNTLFMCISIGKLLLLHETLDLKFTAHEMMSTPF